MKQLCTTILLCLVVVMGVEAQRIITGTVTDQSGEALVGATVAVKSTSTGTVTDIDGRYTIQVAKSDAMLMFSYTGYATQEIAVGPSNTVNVTMVENANVMDEVVVIGYGKQIRSTLTGNIAKVNNETSKACRWSP